MEEEKIRMEEINMIYKYKQVSELSEIEKKEIIEMYGSISQWAWLRNQSNGISEKNWRYLDAAKLPRT